jgi:hypothetical protein
MTVTTSIADTNPDGVTLPSFALAPTPPAAWRPEQDVNDSLFALAERIDHRDPDFDAIAGIAATRLLMAGAELDVIASRRRRAARTTTVTVTVENVRTTRTPRWMGANR